MLPQSNRLPSSTIPLVLRHGKRLMSGYITLVSYKTNNPSSRFAFIIPTTVDKRSAVRNRIKRLLRESVRPFAGTLSGVDCVVIVGRNSNNATHMDINNRIGELFQKAGLRTT